MSKSTGNILVSVAFVERQIADLLALCPELADDPVLRADMIEGETDLHGLLSRIASAALDAKAMQAAIKTRIDDLAARKDAAKRREEVCRTLAYRIMDNADLRKVVLPEATLSIGKVAPSVVIVDEEQIPAGYIRHKTEIDKAGIKAALKDGLEVPGATLSNGGESLTVRVA